MTQCTAEVIQDSIGSNGIRLISMKLRYPRLIHAEFMTHRVFSRNASSSRAIPVVKTLEQVRTAPAMPVKWGKNQPGMQAGEEIEHVRLAKDLWLYAAKQAADQAEVLMGLGAHKQICNRLLEPFQYISVVVTATEWGNFFELRDHPDADPTIQELARAMCIAKIASTPTHRGDDATKTKNWHLPFITRSERDLFSSEPIYLAKASSARCARVSFLTHENAAPLLAKDLQLFATLVGSKPLHASPTEHQAVPDISTQWHANFRGWHQFRGMVERGEV